MEREGIIRVAWLPLVTEAPGPADERAWHICCVGGFVPVSGTAEPAGSEHHAAAPYSSTSKNRLRPHLVTELPIPELEGTQTPLFTSKL